MKRYQAIRLRDIHADPSRGHEDGPVIVRKARPGEMARLTARLEGHRLAWLNRPGQDASAGPLPTPAKGGQGA